MNYAILLSYMLAILFFLGPPGPVTALVIHSSSTGGLRKGLYTIAGTNLASLLLIGISFIVLRGFLAVNENMLTILTLFGALYMLYFAWSILRSQPEASASSGAAAESRAVHPLLNGFLVGISNRRTSSSFCRFSQPFWRSRTTSTCRWRFCWRCGW
ncbi:MAG: LysE family transporter [Brachymonas sp.]|nr:LysE family transporter [Brachymonas sp.]